MTEQADIKRVLIFDDDADYRALLRTYLGKFFTGTELVEYDPVASGAPDDEFAWSTYDVLLLDYYLCIYGLTGLDLLKKHGKKKGFPATLMLTSEGNEEVAVNALKFGVHEYLRKETLNKEELYQLVIKAHERHKESVVKSEEQKIASESFNKALFYKRLEKIAEAGSKNVNRTFSLINVDNFNDLKANLGIIVVDNLVNHIAKTCYEVFKSVSDKPSVTRFSESSIGLLMNRKHTLNDLEAEIKKLFSEFDGKPFKFGDTEIDFTISVGVNNLESGFGSVEDIVEQTHSAVDIARKTPENSWHLFGNDEISPPDKTKSADDKSDEDDDKLREVLEEKNQLEQEKRRFEEELKQKEELLKSYEEEKKKLSEEKQRIEEEKQRLSEQELSRQEREKQQIEEEQQRKQEQLKQAEIEKQKQEDERRMLMEELNRKEQQLLTAEEEKQRLAAEKQRLEENASLSLSELQKKHQELDEKKQKEAEEKIQSVEQEKKHLEEEKARLIKEGQQQFEEKRRQLEEDIRKKEQQLLAAEEEKHRLEIAQKQFMEEEIIRAEEEKRKLDEEKKLRYEIERLRQTEGEKQRLEVEKRKLEENLRQREEQLRSARKVKEQLEKVRQQIREKKEKVKKLKAAKAKQQLKERELEKEDQKVKAVDTVSSTVGKKAVIRPAPESGAGLDSKIQDLIEDEITIDESNLELEALWVKKALDDNRCEQVFQPVVAMTKPGEDKISDIYKISIQIVDTKGKITPEEEIKPKITSLDLQHYIDRWMLQKLISRIASNEQNKNRYLFEINAAWLTDITFFNWLKKLLTITANQKPGQFISLVITDELIRENKKRATSLVNTLNKHHGFGTSIAVIDSIDDIAELSGLIKCDFIIIDYALAKQIKEDSIEDDNIINIYTSFKKHGEKVITTGIEDSMLLTDAIEFGTDYVTGNFIGEPQSNTEGSGFIESMEIIN